MEGSSIVWWYPIDALCWLLYFDHFQDRINLHVWGMFFFSGLHFVTSSPFLSLDEMTCRSPMNLRGGKLILFALWTIYDFKLTTYLYLQYLFHVLLFWYSDLRMIQNVRWWNFLFRCWDLEPHLNCSLLFRISWLWAIRLSGLLKLVWIVFCFPVLMCFIEFVAYSYHMISLNIFLGITLAV